MIWVDLICFRSTLNNTQTLRLGRGIDVHGRKSRSGQFLGLVAPAGHLASAVSLGRGRGMSSFPTGSRPVGSLESHRPAAGADGIGQTVPRVDRGIRKPSGRPAADNAPAVSAESFSPAPAPENKRLGTGAPQMISRSTGSTTVSAAAIHQQALLEARSAPLSQDTVRRLGLAEAVAQKTANGTITAELQEAEQRVNLYLDAGLLGIPPEEMARQMVQGRTEQEIVEQYYKKIQEGTDRAPRGSSRGKRKIPGRDVGVEHTKRVKVDSAALAGVATLTEKSIQEALVAIGAA